MADSIRDREEREKLERDELERQFRCGPHYPRWKRLERRQKARFKRSVDDSKHFFDFIRMVLTTALLFGLVGFVFSNTAGRLDDTVEFSLLAIPLIALAIMSAIMTWASMSHFLALTATQFAVAWLWPFKSRSRGETTLTYLGITVVQAFFLASLFYAGWLVAQQASQRTSPNLSTIRPSSETKP
jgi:hypothetical protein